MPVYTCQNCGLQLNAPLLLRKHEQQCRGGQGTDDADKQAQIARDMQLIRDQEAKNARMSRSAVGGEERLQAFFEGRVAYAEEAAYAAAIRTGDNMFALEVEPAAAEESVGCRLCNCPLFESDEWADEGECSCGHTEAEHGPAPAAPVPPKVPWHLVGGQEQEPVQAPSDEAAEAAAAALAAHRQQQAPSKLERCDRCGREFETPLLLRKHMAECPASLQMSSASASDAAPSAPLAPIASEEEVDFERCYQTERSDVSTLLIIFSAHHPGVERVSYDFRSAIDNNFRVHTLRVRDQKRAWYLRGIIGIADDFQGTVDFFQREKEQLGASEIMTLGSSMGGYAALVFGHVLGASKAITFSPQLCLDARTRAEVGCNTYKYEGQLGELERFTQGTPLEQFLRISDMLPLEIGEVQIHMGQNEHEDMAQADTIRHAVGPELRLVVWPGGSHIIASQLKEEGKLGPLLQRAIPYGALPLQQAVLKSDEPGSCEVCGQPGRSRCARCKRVWYCGKECQKSAWKQHKTICVKV